MNLSNQIATLRQAIANPREGLPDEVFYFISELTPLINVDLLIQDAAGRTLLTWRSDRFYGPGWHIPGGIIRFKETIQTRIQKVAQNELGAEVLVTGPARSIQEKMATGRNTRGHFISMLFPCQLLTQPTVPSAGLEPQAGQWAWFESSPENLISVHDSYRPFIDGRTVPDTAKP